MMERRGKGEKRREAEEEKGVSEWNAHLILKFRKQGPVPEICHL